MESRRAISDLLSPSDARRRTSSAWSEALRGRPCWRPSCRACSIPARTRSLRISRSNSAKTATKATSSSWSFSESEHQVAERAAPPIQPPHRDDVYLAAPRSVE